MTEAVKCVVKIENRVDVSPDVDMMIQPDRALSVGPPTPSWPSWLMDLETRGPILYFGSRGGAHQASISSFSV